MSGDPGTAALRLEDFRGISAAAERVVGLLDSSVIAQRAAQEASRVLGIEFTSVALREQPSLLVMRGAWQTRTDLVRQLRIPVGDGIGGKILLVQKPLSVEEYAEESIGPELIDLIARLGRHPRQVGVPLSYDGQVVGVLYAGARPIGRIGDRAQTLMMEFARTLGPAIGAAMQSERSARLCVQEERQRIARELHDTIGQLLFGIGVSARRARGSLPVRATDLLASAGDFVVVGEASSGAAALEAARREQPDRIILDLRLPDMLAPNLCRELRSAAPGARTVILTAFDDRALLQACLDQGAGILLKDVHDLDLLCALREVRAGRTVVEERVMQHPCNRARQLHLGDDGATVYGPLTPRE